jgi:hypothetical protein
VTRWRKASTRRPRRDGRNGAVWPGKGRGARAKGRSTITVDEYDTLILLRSSAGAPASTEGIAELARFLGGEDDARSVFTIVVAAENPDAELWTRLSAILDSLRDRDVTTLRLALSGAGANRAGRPAIAQRIANAWGFEVLAPDASVLIVPGGSLFALGPGGGWRSFTSGAEPTTLGPRSPAPPWQPTFARLPSRTAGGYVVEQVPAGILVRSAKAPRTRSDDLCYAVPVDDTHPTVLVDASRSRGEPEVPAEDIAALLGALPDTTRSEVRLAPCGPADLLPVGQDTAEILGAEVEVLTGLPLLVDTDTEPEVRPVLIGADAEPTWAPFVEAVTCRPHDADGGAAGPRVARWRSPLSGIRRTDAAAVPLSGRWQVCATRAGLAVGPRGEEPAVGDRPVVADRLAVEVNLRGGADDTLFTELSRLLSEIGPGARPFVTLHRMVPANPKGEEDFRLLRLAIDHGVALAEQPTPETAPPPAVPNVRTVAIPRGRPSSEPAATPATHSSPVVEGLPAPAPARWTASVPGATVTRGSTGPGDPGGPAEPTGGPNSGVPMAPAYGGPARPERNGRAKPGPGATTASSAGDLRVSGSGATTEGRTGPPEPTPHASAVPPHPDAAGPAGPGPRESQNASRGPEPADSGDAAADEPTPPVDAPLSAGVTSLPPGLAGIPLAPVTPRNPATPDPRGQAAERTPDTSGASATPTESSAGPAAPAGAAPGDSTGPVRGEGSVRPGSAASPSAPAGPPPDASPEPAARSDAAVPEVEASPSPSASTGSLAAGTAAAPVPRPRAVAKPIRRSTEAQRTEFRKLAQAVWERHSAAVNRAMTRMPALRGPQMDAARTDLVAVHVHLSGGLDELGPHDPGDGVPAGYHACLSSGLGRLPSYRGVAVRGGLSAGDLERFVPGGVLRDSGPVSALPIGAAGGLPATAGGYVIWSSTGRRVRPLLGSGPGATSDEVVFPPGAVFRVLDVRSAGPAPTVLLVEVVGGGVADDRPGGLSDADRAALERLDEALRRQASTDGGAAPATWPARCSLPLGRRGGTS